MRRVVVTGANKGIGKAIAIRILAEQTDTFVYLGARNAPRGQAARDEILATQPDWSDRLAVLQLDVTDADSIARAAAQVAPLFGLVNNAGTGEGDLQTILGVNFFGLRAVTEQMLPLLDETNGRIVQVSSASGPMFVSRCSPARQQAFTNPDITRQDLDALIDAVNQHGASPQDLAQHGFGDGRAYGLSKALVNAYTILLARERPNLTINACTPGFIETDMTRHYAVASGQTPAQMGMKQPMDGALSPLFLLFGDVQGNGRFYGSDAKRSPLDRYRSPGDPEYTGD
ncbi:MAG: SDR family NAD(P)-dependent oxidoreductase [Myxococcota bacterium]